MTTDLTKIIDKIKKLLKVADTSLNSFEEESAVAMAKIQEILIKHNLSMLDIETVGDDCIKKELEVQEVDAVTYRAPLIPQWLSMIMESVSKLTETVPITYKTKIKTGYYEYTISFIGDITDAYVARETFLYLKSKTTKMSTKYKNDIEGSNSDWMAYANGCSSNIFRRVLDLGKSKKKEVFDIKEEQDLAEDTEEKYELLIRKKSDAIDEYLRDMDVQENPVFLKPPSNTVAWNAGYSDGEKIPLTKQKMLKDNKNDSIE